MSDEPAKPAAPLQFPKLPLPSDRFSAQLFLQQCGAVAHLHQDVILDRAAELMMDHRHVVTRAALDGFRKMQANIDDQIRTTVLALMLRLHQDAGHSPALEMPRSEKTLTELLNDVDDALHGKVEVKE